MGKKIAFTLSSFFIFCACAAAGVELGPVRWQKSASNAGGPKLKFADAGELRLSPGSKSYGKIRILVSVSNNGAQAAEGNIIRCAFSMRLVRAGMKEGIWTVPFCLEERRVAKVKPGASVEVMVSHIDLQGYLKRLRDTGYWPDAIKVSVMAEPRAGDDLSRNVAESVIKVVSEGL